MGRSPRLVAAGLVYQALNRGNNCGPVFVDTGDDQQSLHALAQTMTRYPVELYAYCLMGNHFHLVPTPRGARELAALRCSVTSGPPYGAGLWAEQMAARLGLDRPPRCRGRPPKAK